MSESTAVATTQSTTIQGFIESNMDKIRAALPNAGLTAERFSRIVLTTMNRVPKLKKCTPVSIINCVLQVAELGLSASNTLGQAYLIPYGNECTLIVGYRGFIELMMRTGKVENVYAFIVYDKEDFKVQYGSNPSISHTPLAPDQRGDKKVGVYAVLVRKDGTSSFAFMWADEVEKIRKRSKASSSGPWVTDEEEMWKKTAIRRIAKTSALSPDVVQAAVIDEYREAGIRTAGFTILDDEEDETEEPKSLSNTVKPATDKKDPPKEEGQGWKCPEKGPDCQFFVTHGDEPFCDRENKECDRV